MLTPPFHRRAPWISFTRVGGIEAALAQDITPALQEEALVFAGRLVREELGGTFWAPASPDTILLSQRVLVSAGHNPARNQAMLNEALAQAPNAARVLVLLPQHDPHLHAAATKHGCAILSGPTDPWPLLTGAAALHAESSDPLATLARLAGLPVHAPGPAAQGTPGNFAAAYLLLATSYADPYRGGFIACDAALDIVAEWRRITRANRAIGACAGMSFWKRARMRAFLHDGTRAPPHAATPAALIATARGGAIACWSSRIPKGLAEGAARSGTKLMRVEDGFVRSRGLGSGFLPPCSIIVDAAGIYYDPATPSDLETLLSETDFPPALLERARRLTARMVSESVTKYAAGGRGSLTLPTLDLPDAGGRRLILVPGQVSDDLSVLRGGAGIAGNEDLLAHVRARNPDAFLIYKPHPDVDAGHRAGRIPDAAARRHADCVIRDAPISALMTAADEIHTLTSLAGFEALLRGRHVTTYGQPFYAGWGLTEDLAPPPRRGRHLTLEELSAGVLIIYPRYMDPVTELPCSAETLLDRLAEPSAWRQTKLMRLRRLQGLIRAGFAPRRRA